VSETAEQGVVAAARSNGKTPQNRPVDALLSAVSARWREVAHRFGVTEVAREVGELLLRWDLDLEARDALLGGVQAVGVPRAHVLASLAARHAPDVALAGVGELEELGILVARESQGGWMAEPLLVAPEVRAHCLKKSGSHDRASRCQLPRLERVIDAVAGVEETGGTALVVIRGKPGSGRDAVLDRLLARCDQRPWARSVSELRVREHSLEPRLSGRVAVWDARGTDVGPEDRERASRFLAASAILSVALLDPEQDAPMLADRVLWTLECGPRDRTERVEVWHGLLAGAGLSAEVQAQTCETLALRNGAGVGMAARSLRSVDLEGCATPEEVVGRIELALRQLTQPSNTRGVTVEAPGADAALSSLVLSASVSRSLEHVLVLAKSTRPQGDRRGVKAMFSGASGTGKTLASRALARALDRPLYRVDLASLVSKWLGETEKNLQHAFRTAEAAGAVLLFDEGDALFAKRGEVEKGTDRYANLEVSYLLQAFEAHEGLVLVTTNAKQQIDRAFLRRFDVAVEFHVPTAAERVALWRRELGASGRGLSDAFRRRLSLADLTGGNIASASRLARALAWDQGALEVSEADVAQAVESELHKLGASASAARWMTTGEEK